uniref:Conotoxin Bt3.5 n=1 Tax=Conus betulinus TaxID=89764 RepID=F5BDG3_CONBE|nr:conotoxin Bt3.5 [Conus betulinus]
MMSKLGVLLTICLLLFPLTALPMDGDQTADKPAQRKLVISPTRRYWTRSACCYIEEGEKCPASCKLCC